MGIVLNESPSKLEKEFSAFENARCCGPPCSEGIWRMWEMHPRAGREQDVGYVLSAKEN